jgi:mercuric ion transport protein
MMRNHIGDSAKDGVLAAGGILGAIGASSCCVVPLVLALAGVSGAWIGRLTTLAPYQPAFLAIGAIFVGSGFWRAYGRREACDGPECGTPASRRWTRMALWLGAALLLSAATIELWAPLVA